MLSRFIQRILGRTRLTQRRINARKRSILNRPSLENLEGRRLLAFTTPVTIPVTGISPAGIAVGDYNTDGRDDMAVVNSGSGTVSILLANADGSFAPQVDYAVNTGAVDASMGDLNGDSKLDLVVVSSSAVDVLLGNGDGTFGTASSFAATLTAHSVKVGDFNNDSKMDIGTTNSNSASVLLGNGDGSVQAPLVASVPGNNINLVTGDFDHDGNPELILRNYSFCHRCATATLAHSALAIMRFLNGKFRDVTSEYPDRIRTDADVKLRIATEPHEPYEAPEIALASYLFDKYRLGEIQDGRTTFDRVCLATIAPTDSQRIHCAKYRMEVESAIAAFATSP